MTEGRPQGRRYLWHQRIELARKNWWKVFGRRVKPWLWILPCIGFLAVFVMYPLCYSLFVSLHKWNMMSPLGPVFVGLANFWSILTTDTRFYVVLRNTMMIVAMACSLELLLGIGIALLLTTKELRRLGALRSIILIPSMIMPVAVGNIWRALFMRKYGPINHLLTVLGFSEISWLQGFPEGLFAFVISDVWQWTPFVALVCVATLFSLPKEPFEAAEVDGGTKWQIFWYVTLPLLLRNVMVVVILIRSIDLLKAYPKIYTLTMGGPGYATQTMTYYIFEEALLEFDMGYAAALSYLLLGVSIMIFSLLRKSLRSH